MINEDSFNAKMRQRGEDQPSLAERDSHQVPPQRINHMYEPTYKPKLLLKSPSMRALRNYNNLSLDNTPNTYENLSFIPESGVVDVSTYDVAYSTVSNDSKLNGFASTYDFYDYTTLGSSSVKTTVSNNGSELDSEKNDMGSTTKLVKSKMELSCQSWMKTVQTVLCTISLAAGFGNLYRLPQTTLLRGGPPFLVAYIILTILIGLPLLFLELGIGQLAQEGFIKSWRVVPFFKGIGYVKLIAGCLLTVYYPLYMGLSFYYLIWIGRFSIPFPECAVAKMTQDGYSADGIDGQQCLKKTFLESPFNDPEWYGIYAGLLLVIWIIVIILSIRRTKTFTVSLSLLLLPVLACLIVLTVQAVYTEEDYGSLEKLASNIDWSILKDAYVWYYAAIQVFFSTNVGFGTFVTSAGIIYTRVNPLWTALGYISINLIFGVGSAMLCYIFSGEFDSTTPKTNDINELHLMTMIYTAIIKNDYEKHDARIVAIVIYATILLSGFISMATFTYTLLKAITVQNRRRLKWWQTSIVLSFLGLVLGCAVLLESEFKIVRLLDHYVVGNFILVSVIIEVLALITFYGTERIKSDFEFMLGHILSNVWLLLWWLLPVFLTAIFAWALITLPYEDTFVTDPIWMIGAGWGLVLTATIFIFLIGLWTITQQNGYTFIDKCKASFKPSHNWGPKDPMLRHTWVQWNSKAKQGERDFTLKRKGTRDFTKSVKKNAKKALAQPTPLPLPPPPELQPRGSESSGEYIEPYYLEQEATLPKLHNSQKPFRVTSIVDSLEPPSPTIITLQPAYGYKTNLNPLSRSYTVDIQDNSDEYGTFRKGPYVISDSNITHVCHRRFSQSEDATEL